MWSPVCDVFKEQTNEIKTEYKPIQTQMEGIPQEQTNEKWFCGLSTEEKAKVISRLSYYHGNIYEIEEWLKQPRQEE